MTELNTIQLIAIKVLKTINVPCSLSTILSKSQGFFDSKSQLREVLRQLSVLGEVKHQANGQYKITNKSPVGRPAKVVSKAVSKVDVVKPIAGPKKPAKPILMPEKQAKVYPVKQPVLPAANDALVNVPFILPETLNKSLGKLENQLINGELSINDAALKVEVLQRLSLLLSDDIANVLSDVAKDLININGNLSKGRKAS